MSDQKVPVGISVITILMYLGAIMDFALAIFLMLDRESLAAQADLSESAVLAAGIALAFIAVIIGLLAMGLSSGNNGVRLVVAVVMAVRIVYSVYAIITFPEGSRGGAFVTGLVAVIVMYFLFGNQESKVFFGDEPARPELT